MGRRSDSHSLSAPLRQMRQERTRISTAVRSPHAHTRTRFLSPYPSLASSLPFSTPRSRNFSFPLSFFLSSDLRLIREQRSLRQQQRYLNITVTEAPHTCDSYASSASEYLQKRGPNDSHIWRARENRANDSRHNARAPDCKDRARRRRTRAADAVRARALRSVRESEGVARAAGSACAARVPPKAVEIADGSLSSGAPPGAASRTCDLSCVLGCAP